MERAAVGAVRCGDHRWWYWYCLGIGFWFDRHFRVVFDFAVVDFVVGVWWVAD